MVYLTVSVPNIKPDYDFSVTDEGHFCFTCEGGSVGSENKYALDLQLFGEVDASACAVQATARHAVFKVVKKAAGPYWERLLKEAGKNVHMAIDWDHWKDEDEEDDFAFGSQFNDTSRDLQDMDFGPGESDDSDDEANGVVEAE